MKKNLEKGQVMIIVTMLFLMVSLTMVLGFSGPVFRGQRTVTELLDSRKSYFLAEAGMEDVMYRVSHGRPYDTEGETLTIDGSTVTTVTDTTGGRRLITSSADWNGSIRNTEALLIAGDGVAFYYGVQIGQGGFTIGNNSGINGSIYSNGTITGSNGSYITGSAVAVTSIDNVNVGTVSTSNAWAPTVSNINVTGVLYCNTGTGNNKSCDTSRGIPETQEFPVSSEEILDWKADAAVNTYVGNMVISGTENTLGPINIQGDLTLQSGSSLTVTGTIWVTGNIILDGDASMSLSSGYGYSGGIIMADGTVTLGNGAGLFGSGSTGSYVMLISLSDSASSITMANNAAISVILYAPNGTIVMGNNANVRALTAKTINLGNNTVLTYTQGLLDAVFDSGPSGGWQLDSWKEI